MCSSWAEVALVITSFRKRSNKKSVFFCYFSFEEKLYSSTTSFKKEVARKVQPSADVSVLLGAGAVALCVTFQVTLPLRGGRLPSRMGLVTNLGSNPACCVALVIGGRAPKPPEKLHQR